MKIRLFLFIILLFGCQVKDGTENGLKVFSLENAEKVDKLRFSDLGIKDIRYIPLETTEESVISSGDNLFFHDYTINKIIQAKNEIFFKNHDKIFRFKLTGEFEKVISPIGRGPTEVTKIFDFDIDINTNEIYILSGHQKKIKVYNKNGDFLREIDLPLLCRELDLYEDRIILYCSNQGLSEYSYIILDLNGNILKNIRNNYQFTGNERKSGYGLTHENLFYRTSDKLFKKEVYSDTIYQITGDTFVPHLVVEAGDRLISPDDLALKDLSDIFNNYIQPITLFEFGQYIYYQYYYKYNIPSDVLINGFIGSKTNDFAVVFDAETGIIDDIDGGPNFQPLFVNGEDEIVSLRDPIFLKSYIKSESFKNSVPKNPGKKKEFEEFVNNLEDTDNPVLMFAY
jgi:hypothetical protein